MHLKGPVSEVLRQVKHMLINVEIVGVVHWCMHRGWVGGWVVGEKEGGKDDGGCVGMHSNTTFVA